MTGREEIDVISDGIAQLRQVAERILEAGGEIEAVKWNVRRILASVAMLEFNISDVRELL